MRVMKRVPGALIGLLAIVLSAALPSFSQAVIENPAKPKAANAGRVVTPTEVLAISDEGTSDYYFKWPHALAAGPDGGLLLTDVDQVLWFGGDGRFLGNLFKKGQGPGEMPWTGTPVAAGKAVVVYAVSPGKLVYFDAAGKYEKEIAARVEGRSGLSLIGYLPGRFLFEGHEFPRVSGDPDFVDNPRTIYAVSEAGGPAAPLATFATRAWVVTAGGGGGMFDVTSLIAIPFQDKFLALTHTEDYLIKLFDPAANKVVREFRRPYARLKGEPLTEAEKKGGIIINDKHYTRPERKFENDVKNLLDPQRRDLGRHIDEGQVQGHPHRRLRRRGRLPGLFLAQAPGVGIQGASSRRASAPSTAISSGSSSGPRMRRFPSRNTGSSSSGAAGRMREEEEDDMRSSPRRPS